MTLGEIIFASRAALPSDDCHPIRKKKKKNRNCSNLAIRFCFKVRASVYRYTPAALWLPDKQKPLHCTYRTRTTVGSSLNHTQQSTSTLTHTCMLYSRVSGLVFYLPEPTNRTPLMGLWLWGALGWGQSIWAAHSVCTRKCASICQYCLGCGCLLHPCLCWSGLVTAQWGYSRRRPAELAGPPEACCDARAWLPAAYCGPGTTGR